MSSPYDDLDTPSLIVDLDPMERNIAEMAGVARAAGVRLRPHTKTCPEIALMQLEAGATGITCAKIGEAEVMADTGIDDILIAFPIWGTNKLRRLRALMERAGVRVSLDSVQVAEGLGALGRDTGRPVEVLVEVDTGMGRLGRPPGQPTAELAAEVARVPGVDVAGLLTHAGHSYDARSAEERDAIAEREGTDLVETAAACEEAGVPIREISVGSTPTARVAARVPGVTELRPGTYVFNDVRMMRLGVATEETCALRVLATVVAHPTEDRFVIDAGTKCLTSDGGDGPPFPGWGLVPGRPELRLDFLNEEHGVFRRTGPDDVAIGERLEIVPIHASGCANMFDVAYGVRDGKVVGELWIAGRGRVR